MHKFSNQKCKRKNNDKSTTFAHRLLSKSPVETTLESTCTPSHLLARNKSSAILSPVSIENLTDCSVRGIDGGKKDTTHEGRRRGRVVERGLDSVRWFREEDRRKLSLRRGNRWTNPLVFQPRHVLSWLYSFAFRFVVGEQINRIWELIVHVLVEPLIGFAYTNWGREISIS